MTRVQTVWNWTFLVCFACLPLRADTFEFIPELDANLKLNSFIRLNFQAKEDRDGGDPLQVAIGPSVQFYLKPLVKLKNVTAFDLNDAKSRPLVLEIGYRHITAPDAAPEERMQVMATSHFPLKAGLLLEDRNRADLDWKKDVFTWRYRNKLALQRTFSILSYHPSPYVASEFYYQSQYNDKWSTIVLFAGCLFPVGKHVQIDSYYDHENDTYKRPNKQIQAIGLAVHFYFSIAKE